MKAYTINLDKIEEGYLYDMEIVHADTRGKAKREMLKKIRHDNYQLRNGDELNFVNIPLIRNKKFDKILFEGEWITIQEKIGIEKARIRARLMEAILSDENTTHCYIKKNGEYYRDDHCGYTSFKFRAGVYSKEEAVGCGKLCSDLDILRINKTEHNEMITKEIESLKNRLL